MAAAPTGQLLALLEKVLRSEQPANVDREAVTLTGEGPGEGIVLVPHRDLGGYSLILWFAQDWLRLGWASVIDLEYHDELDVGKVVLEVRGSNWFEDVASKSAISAEFRRPIRVSLRRSRVLRRWQVRCAVNIAGEWAETWAGNVPAAQVTGLPVSIETRLTSLTGPEPAVVHCPVPTQRWHRHAEPGWPDRPPT